MNFRFDWKTYAGILAGIFALFLCIHYWPQAASLISSLFSAAMPVFQGCIFAYVINILMSFYEKYYFPNSTSKTVIASRRPVCMIGAMITIVGVVIAVISLVVPQLVSCVTLLSDRLPSAMEELIGIINQYHILPEDISAALSGIDWAQRLSDLFKWMIDGFGSIMDIMVSTVSTIAGGLISFVVALIFAIYLLSSKEKMGAQANRFLKRYLRPEWYEKLMYVLYTTDECFHSFVCGQCTEAVILGTLCSIGMAILRLPYAAMIGALIGFTALIPVVGAFIGGAVGAIVIMTESFFEAVVFLIFLVILQQVEGNLIYPRVVGSSIGLPAFWVLASVTIAGSVAGIPGILFGIPLAAAAYKLIRTDMHKNDPVETESCE
ncbi:MAG: AI-2E family transporter [Bulleidia sp.]